MFNLFRTSYMDARAENKKNTGDEKHLPPIAYELSSGADDYDESTMTLLGDKWETTAPKQISKTKLIFFFVHGLLAVICVSAIIYLSVTVHSMHNIVHLHPTGIELGDCGSSHTVEDARAKGCLFDPMSWLWVRPECYDQSLIDNFMNRTDWSWHTDWRLTLESQVALEEVFAGDHPQLFTSKKYHSIHCTYMWQKMHQALLEHRPVDSDLTDWHHTYHCEEVLLEPYLHEDTECTGEMICPTLVRATWTSCGYY